MVSKQASNDDSEAAFDNAVAGSCDDDSIDQWPNDSHGKSSNFEMMPQKADASALIAHSDSGLAERARFCFPFPRGQPCLVCWG